MSNRIIQFIVDKDGPTTAEYAVMLALIIVVCVAAVMLLGQRASTVFTTAADSFP